MRKKLVFCFLITIFIGYFNCSHSPTSGHAPTFDEMVGTWIITQANQHTDLTYKMIIWGDTIDSSASQDTIYYYSDSSHTYTFYSDSTYRARGRVGSPLLPANDTGRWVLNGNSLTLHSVSGDTANGSVSLSGTTITFTLPLTGNAVMGQFEIYYSIIINFFGVKKQ
jgi:hypothetical protein